MLNYFFEKTDVSNRHLFDGLKIAEHPKCMAEQGQYPVIFLTFKGVKERSWADIFPSIKDVIAEEFNRHEYLAESQAISALHKEKCQAIIDGEGTATDYKNSLRLLSACLHKHHQKRPIILIDEYDAPIHAAFEYRYYEDVVVFMRNFLSGGFKDNPDLAFGVLTGILRVAKESIFSGLNNLRVCTFLQDAYADKFGLVENEVKEIIAHFGVSNEISEVQSWYDGYQSGKYKIYNPWSILNMLDNGGKMDPYWVNTSDNALLKRVMQNGPDRLKIDLEQLLQGIPVIKPINQNIVLPDIMTDESAAWGLLLMSGYLTFENLRSDPKDVGTQIAEFKIPNTEVAWIYKTQILSWFKIGGSDDEYQSLLHSLIDGKMEEFQELFDAFVSQTLSVFDVTGRNPERFYDGGACMLASLRDSHEVVSNRESGTGRYDVSIFPRDVKKPGIIIEFKVTSKYRQETLETAAQNALKQIEDRNYEVECEHGVSRILLSSA